MTKRLITGSRYWSNRRWYEVWERCHGGSELILGDCPTGADLWARRFAEFYQRPRVICSADWKKYGPRAGPIRNSLMVAQQPDDAAAFFSRLHDNRGTNDCFVKCTNARIPIEVVRG